MTDPVQKPAQDSDQRARTAVVYGVPAGVGGLGLQAATSLAALAGGGEVHALGPGRWHDWPLPDAVPDLRWHVSPPLPHGWFRERVLRRWWPGRMILDDNERLGRWAAGAATRLAPDRCYLFTHVAWETLTWCSQSGIPTVLDNPNGHIRNFRDVYAREWDRWCRGTYRGHPTADMVARVEEEYRLADRIRVSSRWARESMIRGGVAADKVYVHEQPVNLSRFRPPAARPRSDGPLRVCYVGSLDLRKGFVYLLRAMRSLGPSRVELEIVGATGDPGSRALFRRERRGLSVTATPGDPVPAYHRAEVFVLPSLEDGFGFVVAEALACGLPVIVTDQCGASELVTPGENGWVVPAGEPDALACALDAALRRRADLAEMGRLGRARLEAREDGQGARILAEWFHERAKPA